MLLSEEEFLAIKDEVVKDVLQRLRDLAGLEARLLFREYRNYPGALPHFSERISKSINRAYGAIRKKLADVQMGDSCDMPDPKRRKVQELLRQGGTRSLL